MPKPWFFIVFHNLEDGMSTFSKENESEKKAEFEALARPLINWMMQNRNPHCLVIVDNKSAQLFEGAVGIINNNEPIKPSKIDDDPYKNPYEAGRIAGESGKRQDSCPIDRRFNANQVCLWHQGWTEGDKKRQAAGLSVPQGN